MTFNWFTCELLKDNSGIRIYCARANLVLVKRIDVPVKVSETCIDKIAVDKSVYYFMIVGTEVSEFILP